MIPVWLTDTVTQDFTRSVRYTLLWGLEGIVLRSMEGARVPDVNEAKLRARLAEADLDLLAVDPGVFEAPPGERAVWMNDLERLDETRAFCERLGCRRIITGALPGGPADAASDVLARAADRIAERNIELCVRNAGEGRGASEEIGEIVSSVGSSLVKVGWDPVAASQASGSNAVELPDAAIGLAFVRRGLREKADPFCLDEATGQWHDALSALVAREFDGPVCLAWEEATSAEALRDATALIQTVRRLTRAT